MKLGFYTLITPEHTPEEIIPLARDWGFEGIEWRVAKPGVPTPGGTNYWEGNRCSLDPEKLEVELAPLVAKGRAAGLESFSLCPYLGHSDLKALDRMFALAAAAGVGMVRVSADKYDRARPYAEQFEDMRRGATRVAALAEKHRVRACMLQHAGTLIPSASACRRLVDDLDPSFFGLYLDVGHFVREGYEDFGIVVDLLKNYLAEVHLRNGWLDPQPPCDAGFVAHAPRWGALDRGQVDLGLLAKTLGKTDWSGWLVLEDFSQRPVELRIEQGLRVMRRMQAVAAECAPANRNTPSGVVGIS